MPIEEYHSLSRRELCQGVNFDDETLLGIEIETTIKSDYSPHEVADEACSFGRIIAERDGDLDSYYGAEFIFAPVPYSSIVEGCDIDLWSRFISPKSKSWSMDWHGMHISINAGKMTNLHVGKFCHFINSNKSLCVKVAKRDQHGYYEDGETPRNEWGRSDVGISAYENVTNRYLAATRRSQTRIEVRIFRSSTNFNRIRKNCEFVDSVRCFTKQCKIDELYESNYLYWLAEEANKYSLLVKELLGVTV